MEVTTYKKKYVYAPLNILLLFNIFTILVFLLGPVDWRIDNTLLVTLYLLCNLAALKFGFDWTTNSYKRAAPVDNFVKYRQLIMFCIYFGFVWTLPMVYIRLGITDFTPSAILDKIVAGYNDPLSVYKDKLTDIADGVGNKTSRFQLFDAFLSPVIYAFQVFSVLYFSRFSKSVQIGIIIAFIIETLSWLGIGTNKGLTDLALIIFFVNLIKNPRLYELNRKTIFITTFCILIILGVFINSMLSRFGVEENNSVLEMLDFNVLGNPLKTTGIYENLNIGIKFSLMQVTSYLAQGYYTIGVAFNEPFTWSYGLGNSWKTIALWDKFTGNNVLPATYIGILEKNHGISSTVAWHSIYVWLASDFTFFGIPFVMFFIGKNLAASWLDSIYKNSLYGNIAFCLFCQMIFYFFANNQIISFSLWPFTVFMTVWLFKR